MLSRATNTCFTAVGATIFLFANSLAVCAQLATPAKVLTTINGDTLKAIQAGDRVVVRLACVAAPAYNQPGGKQSATRLRELLPSGTAVQLRVVGIDLAGRKVAEVFKQGRSINLQLVREGMVVVYQQQLEQEGKAVVFRQQDNACNRDEDIYHQSQYNQAQNQAIQKQLGFWGQNSPIMPWDWRRQNPAPRR